MASLETTSFKAANLFMAGLFAISAVIQSNDPDPIQWIAIYGLAAAICLLRGRVSRKILRRLAWVCVAIVVAWIALLLPDAISVMQMSDLLQPMNPDRPEIEVGREVGGLAIVLVWMIVIALRARPKKPVGGR